MFNDEFATDNGQVDEHRGVVAASIDQNGEGLRRSAVFVAGLAGGGGGTGATEGAVQGESFISEGLGSGEVVGAEVVRDGPARRDLGFGFVGVGLFALDFRVGLVVEGGAGGREAAGNEGVGVTEILEVVADLIQKAEEAAAIPAVEEAKRRVTKLEGATRERVRRCICIVDNII